MNGKAHQERQTYSRKSFTQKYIKTSTCEKTRVKIQDSEMLLKLKDWQLQTILFLYRLLYLNLMVDTIDTYTKKIKEYNKHSSKVSHQSTREENKRGRKGKKTYRNKSDQLTKWH